MGETPCIVSMTEEMVRPAARVHMNTLPDSRTALMGEAYVTAFISWLREPEHGGIALAAVDDQAEVVGYVIGAPVGYSRALSRHLFWISAAATAAHPALIFRSEFQSGLLDRLRLAATGKMFQSSTFELPALTMSLVAMGVLPAARRQKTGLRLVESFEGRAREMGMRSMRLSTRSDNIAARSFYESCGWRLLEEAGRIAFYFRLLNA
jgi:ribosomal protein S18 acetylase RimI-like enzyme